MRALLLLCLLLLSGCGYSSAEYWEMFKTSAARTLCNVANKGGTSVDCQARDEIRPY